MRDHKGSTAIEYGMIGSLVAVGIIGGINSTSESLGNIFNSISFAVAAATTAAPSGPPSQQPSQINAGPGSSGNP